VSCFFNLGSLQSKGPSLDVVLGILNALYLERGHAADLSFVDTRGANATAVPFVAVPRFPAGPAFEKTAFQICKGWGGQY